jgi:serine/threonine protein kinase
MSKLWEPGDRIEHWLVLERFLGGWGVVYALRDLRNTEGSVRPAVVAGKTIRPEWASERSRVEQFEMEAYGWLSLGVYKHIVRLYTVERLHGHAVAIGEYVPAGALPNTLRGWIDAGILGFESALRFGVHICRALEHARSRGLLAHLDLKPENIMITQNGVAKVTDWGLSRLRPLDSAGIPSLANLPFNPPKRRWGIGREHLRHAGLCRAGTHQPWS